MTLNIKFVAQELEKASKASSSLIRLPSSETSTLQETSDPQSKASTSSTSMNGTEKDDTKQNELTDSSDMSNSNGSTESPCE